MNELRKKKFRNPLKSLRRKTIVGRYDLLPDNSFESIDDAQVGSGVQRQGIAEFNLDLDLDDSSDSDDDTTPWSNDKYGNPDLTSQFANEPFYFETTFDDIPVPNEPQRVVSSYFERLSKPPSTPPRPRHVRSDSDTSKTADTGESFEAIRRLPNKQRSVRFADEEGMAIETVHVTEREEAEAIDGNRVIVLLLSPKRKRFEFLHVQYGWEERTQLSEAFKQFPYMASDPCFTKQHYVGMCRPWRGGQELINSLAIQDYDMGQDELLVAIPFGMKSKHIMKLSQPLITNRNVLKTVRISVFSFEVVCKNTTIHLTLHQVKRKMRNGFAVQKLQEVVGGEPQAESGENSPELEDSEFSSATDTVERECESASLLQSVNEESMTEEKGVGIMPLNPMNNDVSSRKGKPAVDNNERVENSSVSSDLLDDDDQSVTETTSVVTVDDLESIPDMDRFLCAKQKDDEDLEKADMTVKGSFFATSDGTRCGQVTIDVGKEKGTKARDSDKSRFRFLNAYLVAAGFLYQIVPGKQRHLRKKRSSRTMAEI
jgi:hypothetical protein